MGCSQGAKSSADVSYWPLSLRKRNIELKTNCRVKEIKINKKGFADKVIYYDNNNNEIIQKAEVVIIACNGIGTPRLLLNSTSINFPNGLANKSGLLGKNLMLHPWGRVEAFIDKNIYSRISSSSGF